MPYFAKKSLKNIHFTRIFLHVYIYRTLQKINERSTKVERSTNGVLNKRHSLTGIFLTIFLLNISLSCNKKNKRRKFFLNLKKYQIYSAKNQLSLQQNKIHLICKNI